MYEADLFVTTPGELAVNAISCKQFMFQMKISEQNCYIFVIVFTGENDVDDALVKLSASRQQIRFQKEYDVNWMVTSRNQLYYITHQNEIIIEVS